jgi:hypothetical protein
MKSYYHTGLLANGESERIVQLVDDLVNERYYFA